MGGRLLFLASLGEIAAALRCSLFFAAAMGLLLIQAQEPGHLICREYDPEKVILRLQRAPVSPLFYVFQGYRVSLRQLRMFGHYTFIILREFGFAVQIFTYGPQHTQPVTHTICHTMAFPIFTYGFQLFLFRNTVMTDDDHLVLVADCFQPIFLIDVRTYTLSFVPVGNCVLNSALCGQFSRLAIPHNNELMFWRNLGFCQLI